MRKRQLSLVERWNLDVESYNKGGKVKVSEPQCFSCKHLIKGNALHCEVFQQEEKPKYVKFPSKECIYYENDNPLRQEQLNLNESRFFGGLYGACIGDILGVPVEFTSRKERGVDPVQELRAYGTYHQPFGTWSDDTSLTLCLIDALCKDFSVEKVAQNMITFYRNAEFTPHGEVFDIGNATREAIERMELGITPSDCGGKEESDNGNGSLMRVLPLAYYGKNLKEKELVHLIEQVSSLTHGHVRSKFACIFYVVYAIQLMEGKDKVEAYSKTIDFMNRNCQSVYEQEYEVYHRVLNKELFQVEQKNIKSTGYVVDSLEASLWAFLNAHSFKEVVFQAVNLGGDTDTNASIAGGLAGIYYGFKDIPNNWIQCIAKKEMLQNLFQELYCKVGN